MLDLYIYSGGTKEISNLLNSNLSICKKQNLLNTRTRVKTRELSHNMCENMSKVT